MAIAIMTDVMIRRLNQKVNPCSCGAKAEVRLKEFDYELIPEFRIICVHGHMGRAFRPENGFGIGQADQECFAGLSLLVWDWNNPAPTVKEYMERHK